MHAAFLCEEMLHFIDECLDDTQRRRGDHVKGEKKTDQSTSDGFL